MEGFVARTLLVAQVTLRANLLARRTLGLLGIAAIPTLVELGLVAGHADPARLVASAVSIFLALTIAIVAIVVTLLVGVGAFRSEIEDDTLSYLWSRSIPREAVALGKYLGGLAATLVLVVPWAMLPLGIGVLAGGPAPPEIVPLTMVVQATLACVAYLAIFLLFGLLSRSALILGLLFGFLWEELLPLLPGNVPRLTVIFYLRSLGSDLAGSTSALGYANPVTTWGAGAAPVLVAVAFLVITAFSLRFAEIAPQRSSA
ncbi:MAG: ABC transporter permease [Thermoplasmata archaeon]